MSSFWPDEPRSNNVTNGTSAARGSFPRVQGPQPAFPVDLASPIL